LTKIRIENAKKLLKEKDLNNYDVCMMVGYDNPTYFSKVFKRVTGLTPSQYRNKIRQGNIRANYI
jgi:two-component system response regulator YesN